MRSNRVRRGRCAGGRRRSFLYGDDGELRLEVRDDGVGIAPEQRAERDRPEPTRRVTEEMAASAVLQRGEIRVHVDSKTRVTAS